MNDSVVFMKCPACGAINRLNVDRQCWVCEQPLDQKKGVWLEFDEETAAAQPVESATAAGSLGLIGAVLLVCFGTILIAPGLGFLLLILSIIPLVRTLHLVDPARDPGRATALFFTSVVVSLVIVTILGCVAVGTFCLTLFGVCALDPRGPGSEVIASVILWGVPLFAVILTAIPLGKWVIRRYRRDRGDGV